MTTSYNQIAGRSVERLAALSDGIFAVAMTLLVLDLRAPALTRYTVNVTFGTPWWRCRPGSSCT